MTVAISDNFSNSSGNENLALFGERKMTNKKCLLLLFVPAFLLSAIHLPASDVRCETPSLLIEKGKSLIEKGDTERAASVWEQALGTINREKESGLYFDTALNLSNAYQALGYHQKSLATLRSCMPVAEKHKNKSWHARLLNALGDLYLSLGRISEATETTAKSVEEARLAEDPEILAASLNSAGNVLAVNGYFESAMASYEECLDIIGKSGKMKYLKSKVLVNVARLLSKCLNYDDSVSALDHAIEYVLEMPDSAAKAFDLVAIGRLYREIANVPEIGKLKDASKHLSGSAFRAFREAGRIAEKHGDNRTASYASGYMGRLYEDGSKYKDALILTRKAIFMARGVNCSRALYLWQWQLGRLLRAQNKTGEAIGAYKEAVSTLNPIRRELFTGLRSQKDIFDEQIKPIYLELADLLLARAEKTETDAEREKGLLDARNVMELLKTAELQDFFGDECVAAVKEKSVTFNRAPEKTAILYPISLSKRLVLLLTLPDGMKQFSVPIDSEKFKKTVKEFRVRLQARPNNRFMHNAKLLYDWLVRPVEADIENIDTLVVAPDGALRLIPFSTLHDGKQFLIEKHAIGTVPGITLADPRPIDLENIKILTAGLSKGVQDFTPLPSVAGELSDIRDIMNGETLLRDEQYTIENLTNEFKTGSYTIMHLATHGVFGGIPEETFLLTYESKLTIDQLENLIGLGRFRESPVQLLTLSACQTALGDERAALGLAGVAVKAGVRTAVATLWYVDDEATSLAVREFYRQIKRPGVSKAQALQNSQKMMIAQLRYRHPAYWAPFLLIGNWM